MRRRWLLALLVLAVIFLLRLPAFWTPILDVDEAQFAGFADVILSGGIPYIGSVDTKPPGIYYFFAAIFTVFGRNNMIAVHVATAIVVALTAWLCFRIGRRLFSAQAGFWAALFYAVFTAAGFPKFIATSIAIVMMLPLAASIDALLGWEKGRGRWLLLASGILWGIACLFKYQAGINLVVVAVYLLGCSFSDGGGRWRAFGRDLLAFASGGALVAALCGLWLFRIGAWDAFRFWSLKGSAAYIGAAVDLPGFWGQLAFQFWRMILWALPLWFFAGAGMIAVVKRRSWGAWLIALWLLLSFIPVCVGGKFYEHYFLQLYPAMAVLAGAGAAIFLAWRVSITQSIARWALLLLFAAGLIVPSILSFGMRLMPERINALIDEETPTDYRQIGEYIRDHTREGERIFVWGFATPVYFYSGRMAAARFLWCDWQTGRVSGKAAARKPSFDPTPYVKPGSWEMLFEDLDRSRPVYFVDTAAGGYHNYGRYPVTDYPRLVEYLRYRYHPEATVDGAVVYRRNGR